MKKIISGKVREVYESENCELVIVTTDRLSAFDVILPTPIVGKGVALNKISNFWFDFTKDIVKNHIISTNICDMPEEFKKERTFYVNRTIKVKKLKMLPYEFVIRGYMFGSMWEAYKQNKGFCGYTFQEGYQKAEKLKQPIMTPSIKMEQGHDVYISIEQLKEELGEEMANRIYEVSMQLYKTCYEYAYEKGIIIADTKFEFGVDETGELVLGDEIFTPDSSRFWDKKDYCVGVSPRSSDKQFVRDWLIENDLNGKTLEQPLPQEIVEETEKLYNECCKCITGKEIY